MQGRGIAIAVVVGAVLGLPAVAAAQSPLGPINDLGALNLGSGQTPDKVAVQHNAEPPLLATPAPASCAPGSRPQPGIDGLVPTGAATDGLSCNLSLVSHQGSNGGFKTFRYTDVTGRTCAYYDTALLYPLNALSFTGTSMGVEVLDMSDPAHPVQTDTLTELPMLSPHESLNVNAKRGLIAAVLGNPATYPGLVSIYDAHADCRHPVLQSTTLSARLGHESGFSEDGNTFYATGTATQSITAIDVRDPKAPVPIWQGNVIAHGMTLSADGNRAYVADPTAGQLLILDTSQIQARTPNPQVREISRLGWRSSSIPQNAIPFTENGHPYLLEFDEYTGAATGGSNDDVGAARIIDIADETKPVVVADLRLQVNQAADHAASEAQAGGLSPVQGFAAHYCNIPTQTDPKLVACSFIASGLRVFDISQLTKPKEIGYFVAPTGARVENGLMASDFAMSKPSFDVDRHSIWYTDGASGFYDVKLADSVWPAAAAPAAAAPAAAPRCSGRRRFTAHLTLPRGATLRSATATLGGKRLKVTRGRRTATVSVDLRKATRSTVTLVIRARTRTGKTRTSRRVYHPCTAARR